MADSNNRFKIPRFYKTLLALSVVVGPIAWLMFTEDGRRRTDLMLLGLMDEPLVEMRLDTLASSATEAQVREFLPAVQWQCANARSSFGERACQAEIGAFNDTPAYTLTLYYEDDALQAMKVEYRASYHAYLGTLTASMLGQGELSDVGVRQWKTRHGLVLMPHQTSGAGERSELIWLSAQRALTLGPR